MAAQPQVEGNGVIGDGMGLRPLEGSRLQRGGDLANAR